MPTFNKAKQKPLPPEGVVKCQIMAVDQGRSSKKNVPFFKLHLRNLESGLEFTDSVYHTENAAWKMEALCRSAGLSLPEGDAGYKLTTDDLVGRTIYGPLKHRALPNSGKHVAEFGSFWSREHAIKQDPDIQNIPDPVDVPEPVTLTAARTPTVRLVTPEERGMEELSMADLRELGL